MKKMQGNDFSSRFNLDKIRMIVLILIIIWQKISTMVVELYYNNIMDS